MTALTEGNGTGDRATTELYENVTCPFCGMLCDDLDVSRSGTTLKIRKNGCHRAAAGFGRPLVAAPPSVEGREAGLTEAIEAAAELIRKAELPLYGGLATDVEGVRAVMSIADRSGGVVDHALSETQYRNLSVLQSNGWIMTTLTEARNRGDLIIVIGDMHALHPRFFDRIVCPPDSMFDAAPTKRDVVFIGKDIDTSVATGPRIGEVVTVPCAIEQVGEVLAAVRAELHGSAVQPHDKQTGGVWSILRAQLRGPSPHAEEVAGVKLADITALAERCRKASYGVIVWAPPAFSFPNADLTVQLIAELVKDLNQTTRFAGLSLGGNEGSVTAAAVSTWQSGYPLRVSFASGKPDYDPYRYSISRMLAGGEGDLLVWLASFTADVVPPATTIPTVVLGTPGIALGQPPAVFIPVGTPGIDHAGRLVRCDNVVSLPLQNLNRSSLPRAADVLAAIEAAL